MWKLVRSFVRNEDGATAIEYALIAAGIGIAIVGGVNALGTEVSSVFTKIKDAID